MWRRATAVVAASAGVYANISHCETTSDQLKKMASRLAALELSIGKGNVTLPGKLGDPTMQLKVRWFLLCLNTAQNPR